MKNLNSRFPEIAKVSAIIIIGALMVSAFAFQFAYRERNDEIMRGLSVAAKSEAILLDELYDAFVVELKGIDSLTFRETLINAIEQGDDTVAIIGETASLYIAWVNEDSIEYILPRPKSGNTPIRVALSTSNAEPMRRALSGLAGTMHGPDYRDVNVIAAYEHVKELGLGIVVKIDASEAAFNFWTYLKWTLLVGLIITTLVVYFVFRVMRPIVRKLYNQNAELQEEIYRRELLEQELIESRKSFRDLVENVSDTVYGIDKTGLVSYISPVVTRVLGYDPASLIGKHFIDYIHPQDRENTLKQFMDSLEGNSYSADLRIAKLNGDYTWVRTSSQAFVEGGTVKGVRGVFMDIGTQKSIEQDLAASEQRLRAITDAARDAVILIDDDGAISYWNPAAERIFGYSVFEALGANVHTLLAPADMDEQIHFGMFNWRSTGQVSGVGKTTEHEAVTKSGAKFPIELSLAATELNHKRYAVGIVRDASDRKRAESALRESEYRFRTVVESLNEGIIITNLDGTILYLNPQLAALCGYDLNELLGEVSDVIIAKNHRDNVRLRTARRLAGETERYEVELLRKNRTTFWVEISAAPFSNSHGKVMGSLAVIVDITERKDADAERMILESQLRQAQKMEAIGTLAGGIAHDFNNILTPILAYTELVIANAPQDQQTTDDLRRVMEAALRAKDLVKQILTFSRQTEHERFPLSPEPIVKEALKLLRASLPSTIEIRYDIHSKSEILADPTHIHQIVINLCTNAAWAMREHGGVLEVSLHDDKCTNHDQKSDIFAPSGQCLKLTIRDTGCGMTEATLSHIFEPFFTTKGVGEGTGLGLSVVHGIVKSSGGDIKVSSVPGKGTKFDLYFPVVTATRSQKPEQQVNQLGGHEHILLIDDEADVASSCARALEQYGYRVTWRTSSQDGFEAFKALSESIDLVITDFTMPHLTGVQLAKMIKHTRSEMPIILMTGFSPSVNESNIHELGLNAMVLKPVIGRELATVVRNVLDKVIAN